MSILEVLISMGVAGLLMTGMLSFMEYSHKSVRNVGANSSWNSFTANVQFALGSQNSCAGMFAKELRNGSTTPPTPTANTGVGGGSPYDGTYVEGTDQPVTLLRIGSVSPAGVFSTHDQLAKVDPTPGSFNYSDFGLRQMVIKADPTRAADTISLPDIAGVTHTYKNLPVKLLLKADKSGSNVGGSSLMREIPFNLITGPIDVTPAKDDVYGCYGISSGAAAAAADAAQACKDLGGVYDASATEIVNGNPLKCKVKAISFTGPAVPSYVGSGDPAGQVIRLAPDNLATPSTNDTSIGLSYRPGDTQPHKMSFHMGMAAASSQNDHRFMWSHVTNYAGAYEAMKLNSYATGQVFGSNASGGPATYLEVGSRTGASPAEMTGITLGDQNVGIASSASAGPFQNGLELMTGTKIRIWISATGDSTIMPNDGGKARLNFLDPTGTEAHFEATTGGNLELTGKLNLTGTGGNVPHGCRQAPGSCTGSGSCTVSCNADEIALSGGGTCTDPDATRGRISSSFASSPNTWKVDCEDLTSNVDVSAWCCLQ